MKQTMRTIVAVVAGVAWPAMTAAQHEAHQPGGSQPGAAALAECVQAQAAVARALEAADARLERARQENSPSAMRDAIDDLQLLLVDLRVRLAPCAALQDGGGPAGREADTRHGAHHGGGDAARPAASGAAPAGDPHAGHGAEPSPTGPAHQH